MRPAVLRPVAHVFVCTNVRRANDPLRSGCGTAGPTLFTRLKRLALEGAVASRVWITATGCQGHCPKEGCAVSLYPACSHFIEAHEEDAHEILRAALARKELP